MKNLIFLSTTHKDYIRKPIKRTKPKSVRQEFRDPISVGKKSLLFVREKVTPPDEDGQEYLDRFKKTRKVDQEPLDLDVIHKYKVNLEKETEYRAMYCKDEVREDEEEDKLVLAEDVKVSMTSYQSSYKDPIENNPEIMKKNLVTIPSTTLGMIEINNRLGVKVGSSEYMDRIAGLGGRIMDGLYQRCQW